MGELKINLAVIADFGLTDKLESILSRHALEEGAVRVVRGIIDEHGIRNHHAIRKISDLIRVKSVKETLFPKLASIHDEIQKRKPIRTAPSSPPALADLSLKRGPGDPTLLNLGADYPVPMATIWPRKHTQTRRIHEFLMAHRVTRHELIEAGNVHGWSSSSANSMWTKLQSPEFLRAGWLLDIDNNKSGQLYQMPPNWDFRQDKPL